MKKLFLTSGIAICLGGLVMAQEPAKASAKKKKPLTARTMTPADPSKKTDTESRLQAKQKHYEALKAAQGQQSPVATTPANPAQAARSKKAN